MIFMSNQEEPEVIEVGLCRFKLIDNGAMGLKQTIRETDVMFQRLGRWIRVLSCFVYAAVELKQEAIVIGMVKLIERYEIEKNKMVLH